eukprot:5252724-Pyramimonas_sp.AAC.1
MELPCEDADVGCLSQQDMLVCCADRVACPRAPLPCALEIQTGIAQSDQAETKGRRWLDRDRGAGVLEAPQCGVGLGEIFQSGVGQ